MKKVLLIFFLYIEVLSIQAQSLTGTIKDLQTHKPIDYASVVVMDNSNTPIVFCHTDAKGKFSLTIKPTDQAAYLLVSSLGYAQQKVFLKDEHHVLTINLRQEALRLKDVEVKSKRLQQKNDTLIYSVAGFRQKQDHSIADVIAKMPGLDVSDNGTISYQGKPINKFYIEGMDLMGKNMQWHQKTFLQKRSRVLKCYETISL